jgi:hypothetical protein
MEADVSSTTAHLAPHPLPEPVENEPFDDKEFLTGNLACDYIEGEVGRYDWERNWADHIKNGDTNEKVRAWLQFYEIDHDPEAIVAYIQNMVKMRPGKWL